MSAGSYGCANKLPEPNRWENARQSLEEIAELNQDASQPLHDPSFNPPVAQSAWNALDFLDRAPEDFPARIVFACLTPQLGRSKLSHVLVISWLETGNEVTGLQLEQKDELLAFSNIINPNETVPQEEARESLFRVQTVYLLKKGIESPEDILHYKPSEDNTYAIVELPAEYIDGLIAGKDTRVALILQDGSVSNSTFMIAPEIKAEASGGTVSEGR